MAMTGILVRLPDEMIAAIDARAGGGGRAKWLRAAAEAALGDGGGVEAKPGPVAVLKSGTAKVVPARAKVAAPERVEGEPAFRRPDDGVLWRSLRGKRGGAREMRDRLGWMEMRVERAVSSLLASGLVRTVEGLMEAVHPSEGS